MPARNLFRAAAIKSDISLNMLIRNHAIFRVINCIAPGSLVATLALILIGAGVALTAERRKLTRARQ